MVLGHESSGIIHSVGSGVKKLAVGDRVCLEPGQPCRRCDPCKVGKYNLCPDMIFAATPPYDGTLCRYYRIPADFCYKLPESMSLEEGALIEPLAVGVHITKQASIKPGETVVVFGAGPVGLLCMAVAKAFGASKIVAVDINEERLQFATQYAATDAFRPSKESAEDSAKRLIQECDLGVGADAAIDASGAEVRDACCARYVLTLLIENYRSAYKQPFTSSATEAHMSKAVWANPTSPTQSWPCAQRRSRQRVASVTVPATTLWQFPLSRVARSASRS